MSDATTGIASNPDDDGLEPLTNLGVTTAERIVEQLRMGIPPVGYTKYFTVGRRAELNQLEDDLSRGMHGRATLVRANYGAGKTHLLNLIRDVAIADNYVTSFVTVSAHHGVRFNRMDQVLSAVCRDIQCPGRDDRGVMSLFRAYDETDLSALDDDVLSDREELEAGGTWQYEGLLSSPPIYIALRAAIVSESDDTRDLVTDWLTRHDREKLNRTHLIESLVLDLHLGDPRGRGALFQDIDFRNDGYRAVWKGLNDLDTISRLCGYRGMVLLFDEFEDVIQNLNNIAYETAALENLFRFFGGEYDGGSYFAVTPDFVRKVKNRLLMKDVFDFPYRRLDELPHFELSPIEVDEFRKLTVQIIEAHAQANEWDPVDAIDWEAFGEFFREQWNPRAPERIRLATKAFVRYLDHELERSE